MKSARRWTWAAALGLSVVAACQDPSIFISAPDLSFVLRGFTEARSARVDREGMTFSGAGNPVVAEMNSLGVSLQGRTISGRAGRNPAGTYFLQEASVETDAVATVSTDVREDWEIKAGRRTAKSPQQTVTRISGATITYAGNETEGTARIPGATTIRTVSRGIAGTLNFEQVIELGATSAEVKLDPSAASTGNPLRTGSFAGPVSITITRTERAEGETQAKVSTYTAKGDRMTADFTNPEGRIDLEGNVALTGSGPDFLGNANASKATIFVDARFQPLRYEFSGTPAVTRVKTGSGG